MVATNKTLPFYSFSSRTLDIHPFLITLTHSLSPLSSTTLTHSCTTHSPLSCSLTTLIHSHHFHSPLTCSLITLSYPLFTSNHPPHDRPICPTFHPPLHSHTVFWVSDVKFELRFLVKDSSKVFSLEVGRQLSFIVEERVRVTVIIGNYVKFGNGTTQLDRI